MNFITFFEEIGENLEYKFSLRNYIEPEILSFKYVFEF